MKEDANVEALLEATQLKKKNEDHDEKDTQNKEPNQHQEGPDLEETLRMLENVERELLMFEIEEELAKKASGGQRPHKG